ncbi:MAG: c-type cytochrome [Gammaproteobacteria bacterium]
MAEARLNRHFLQWLPVAIGLCFSIVANAQTKGDPENGKQLARDCAACHGADGNSPSPVIPKLGGQHEAYLMLAMQAYIDSTRSDSLMRGAILDKSEQELQDIAAFYASQKPASPAGPGGPGGPRGPGARGGPGATIKFDHGARAAAFQGMLAKVADLEDRIVAADSGACNGLDANSRASSDRDTDGVPDQFDAEPDNSAEFAGDRNGDGLYEICNIHQLQAIASAGEALSIEARRQRSYQLLTDLDASAIENYQPIGDCGPTGNCMRALGEFGYAGTFDGQGHTIRNLHITHPERGGVGLIGVLGESGVVMNLHLVDATINGRAGVGGMVGSNFGILSGCSLSGDISGGMAIGGLVGGSGGLINESHFSGTVSGQQAVGGLVGDMTGAVFFSRSSATVSGVRGIGGLVGLNTFGTVLASSASGDVTGTNDVGGLVGVNTDAKIRNSYATGSIDGKGNNIGGIVGFNSLSAVRNSYANGNVSGLESAGGVVGRNNGLVAQTYATGEVNGNDSGGLLIGSTVDGVAERNIDGSDTANADAGTLSLADAHSDWAPDKLPTGKLLDYFCDENRNGYIDPSERRADNYLWDFSQNSFPTIQCHADKTRG